jgi:hypothetical protein
VDRPDPDAGTRSTAGWQHAAIQYVRLSGKTKNIAAALGILDKSQQGIIEIERHGASKNMGPASRDSRPLTLELVQSYPPGTYSLGFRLGRLACR